MGPKFMRVICKVFTFSIKTYLNGLVVDINEIIPYLVTS